MKYDVSATLIEGIIMATFTMRMDDDFKKEFSSVCQELGCNMSTVITMLGTKMIRERRIPFEVSADPFFLPANQAHIERSIKQLEAMHGKAHGECQDFCVWGGYSRGSPTRLPFVFEMQYARPGALAREV